MSNFSEDMNVKAAWGLTLPQWNRLREKERAYYREYVTIAPYFQENQ